MRKKFKVTLVVFLVVILGCFSQVFASSNQNTKFKKSIENSPNVKLLNNTNSNGIDLYTKLLMHMDNETFRDEYGHIVTNSANNVFLDKRNKKFGNASAYFCGYGSYLNVNNDNDIALNSGDFTIDWWQCQSSKNSHDISFCLSSTDSQIKTKMYFECGLNGTNFMYGDPKSNVCNTCIYSKTPTLLNVWQHIAIVKHANAFTLYIDGKSCGSDNYFGDLMSTLESLSIGRFDATWGDCFHGNIDEFRISNGIARWTSDFTPPSYPYNTASEITLNKTTDTLNVGQTDTLTAAITPDDAINKTVSWTSSDSAIVSVDHNTGVITAGSKAGTAKVIATTNDGSNLSAYCTVTVTAPVNPTPTDSSDKAILSITMTNGQTKQYNVTMDIVNKFISWYKLRAAGSGDPFYQFDIIQTSNPSIVKTDYVVFDKISSFEVDDYTK